MNIVPIRSAMTEEEYDRERSKLRQTYGDKSNEPAAKRDQALASLFDRSGWTQERLAKKEGKSQFWISKRLLFARFLQFISTAINPNSLPNNLSERRFRDYWERTSGSSERQRFEVVMKLMTAETKLARKPRKTIWPDIVQRFGDGRWHSASAMADAVGTSVERINDTLETMEYRTNAPYDGARCEKKLQGNEQHFRIYRGGTKGAAMGRMISSEELAERLGPILKALRTEGEKKVAGLIGPAIVLNIANQLQRCLKEWTK
jgi:hypothetical protein